MVTLVTDNGGPFRSFRFEAFIELHPELAHVRTRVRSPGQWGPLPLAGEVRGSAGSAP